jgi:beta-glucanase (GH16 family)
MNSKLICTVFLLAIFHLTTAQPRKRKLVWQENFSTSALDTLVWNYELGNGCPNLCGWGNNERQEYTKTNHQLTDGKLTISALKEGSRYTSTRITTAGKKEFLYGRIEAKAKIPQGHGIWPAFWMLGSNIKQVGWPKCGEIDILEYIGKEPHKVFTSLHTQESHGQTINTQKTIIDNVEQGYHIYAVDWDADKISFYIDDREVYVYQPQTKNENNWPFMQPFYIILNLAIGGNFGGPEVDDAIFPQQFTIDYIKVYQ